MRFIAGLLLLVVAARARAEVASASTVPLVPAVHRGRSVMWKTGAIITATSVGVTLLGAGLTLMGIGHGGLGTCDITEGQQCPITWAAGRHRAPDPN